MRRNSRPERRNRGASVATAKRMFDRPVLDYFKASGKGYQTRINRVLESHGRAQWGSR